MKKKSDYGLNLAKKIIKDMDAIEDDIKGRISGKEQLKEVNASRILPFGYPKDLYKESNSDKFDIHWTKDGEYWYFKKK